MPTLNVYALPELLDPQTIKGETAVVIDVLRASSTVTMAIGNGAAAVQPFLEIEETKKARKIRIETQPDSPIPLLGGERGGKAIKDFDLGNSPLEYYPDRVGGRTVFFTTTNGTRAMYRARLASEIIIASFLNAQAVAETLFQKENIHIICAGTEGHYTEEDLLLAGLLIARIIGRNNVQRDSFVLNIQAASVLELWYSAFPLETASGYKPMPPEMLARQLRNSRGGSNLIAIGRETDILEAARLDSIPTVPFLHADTMTITAFR